MMRLTFFLAAGLCASGAAWAQPAADLPDLPGKDVFQRICSGCHPVQVVLGKGMSREQWGGIVSNMISRGAKGTDAEFAQIVDYLTAGMPPHTTGGVQTAKRKPSGGLLDQAGAADKQIVDDDAAARGRTVYIAQCITCHGQKARGTSNGGVDIVRSLVVLKDRYGDQIGPFLKKGHPMQSGMASTGLTSEQIVDLSHFLHQQVGDTLRTGPYNKVLNVLTGNPAEGKAYFFGAGGCSGCHSPTGDLAGVASKYDPPVLQLKTVFPQNAAFGRRATHEVRRDVTVTVTPVGGSAVSGKLLEMDDFNVALRDASGQYRSFVRSPGVKVEVTNPYAAHIALLDRYTDRDIHNVVAYLETLK